MSFWCDCCPGDCNHCANILLNDDFTGGIAAYTKREFGAPNGVWSAPVNNLQYTFHGVTAIPNSAIWQVFTTPALNGLCISISATLAGGSNTTTKIGIGGIAPNGGASWGYNPAGGGLTHLFSCVDNILQPTIGGCATIDPAGCQSAGGVGAGGFFMKIQDANSGGGLYNISCCIDGSRICTATNIALTFDTTFAAGIMITYGGLLESFSADDLKVCTN